MERPHFDLPHPDLPHPDLPHPDLPHPDLPHPDLPHPDLPHPDLPYPDLRHLDPLPPLDVIRVDQTSTGAPPIADTHPAHAPAPHETHGTRDTAAPAPGHDLTARHDGSTTAG
jgi:hypothetical protein